VFHYVDWILDTIASADEERFAAQSEARLRGNVSIAWSGVPTPSPAELSISCRHVDGQALRATAPMDVRGAELGVWCDPAESVTASCGSASSKLPGVKITGFRAEDSARSDELRHRAGFAELTRPRVLGSLRFTCETAPSAVARAAQPERAAGVTSTLAAAAR
jgi:hypothetical protein